MKRKPKIGISACLLGEKTRYDGGHRLDPVLISTLEPLVEFVPVCPEVELGLGVPREEMRLVGDPESPRLITTETGIDLTNRMAEWALKRIKELEKESLKGFIFKARSPSCGRGDVKTYDRDGVPAREGTGLFARAFMRHFPLVPTEDEDGMREPVVRQNFIERILSDEKGKKRGKP